MNSECINVVIVIAPNISKKMMFVRSDFPLERCHYDNIIVTTCDEIKWAKNYDHNQTFGIVAIVNGKRHEYVFHNITFAEVVYA